MEIRRVLYRERERERERERKGDKEENKRARIRRATRWRKEQVLRKENRAKTQRSYCPAARRLGLYNK